MLFFINLFLFLFLVFIIIIEISFSMGWNRFYYRSGISFFKKKTILPKTHQNAEINEDLFLHYLNSDKNSTYIFKNLGTYEYAFRKEIKMFNKGGWYTQLVHGYLKYDKESRTFIVYGKSNWFPLVFFMFFLTFILSLQNFVSSFDLEVLGIIGFGIAVFSANAFFDKLSISHVHLHLRECLYKEGVVNPTLRKNINAKNRK